jgi:hypothetical protein
MIHGSALRGVSHGVQVRIVDDVEHRTDELVDKLNGSAATAAAAFGSSAAAFSSSAVRNADGIRRPVSSSFHLRRRRRLLVLAECALATALL